MGILDLISRNFMRREHTLTPTNPGAVPRWFSRRIIARRDALHRLRDLRLRVLAWSNPL